MTNLFKAFVLVGVAWSLVVMVDSLFPRDDTDSAESRSGMSLYTDAATGCQYLSAGYSGLTPRLTSNGGHFGCRSN